MIRRRIWSWMLVSRKSRTHACTVPYSLCASAAAAAAPIGQQQQLRKKGGRGRRKGIHDLHHVKLMSHITRCMFPLIPRTMCARLLPSLFAAALLHNLASHLLLRLRLLASNASRSPPIFLLHTHTQTLSLSLSSYSPSHHDRLAFG